MPQDIPLEGSETLAFTPECFAKLEKPPVFRLRALTTREKRFRRRLMQEEGAVHHSKEEVRAEMLRGLRAMWGEAVFAKDAPQIEAYWERWDEFELQRRDDPDLTFEADAAFEADLERIEGDVRLSHRPYARMLADNSHTGELTILSLIAVTVTGWSGIDLDPERERGFLSIDCADQLREAMAQMEERNGVARGLSWAQLMIACNQRMSLQEEEAKNSASPSPSEAPPPSSKPNKANGRSKAPASSTKTPETV